MQSRPTGRLRSAFKFARSLVCILCTGPELESAISYLDSPGVLQRCPKLSSPPFSRSKQAEETMVSSLDFREWRLKSRMLMPSWTANFECAEHTMLVVDGPDWLLHWHNL